MPSCRVFPVVTTNSPLMLHRSYVSQRPSMSSRKQFDPGPASDSTERLRSDNATKPLIPLRLPANLQAGPSPATAPVDTSVEPVEPLREDTDAPAVPAVYRGGPGEFDRVVAGPGHTPGHGKTA